MSAALFVLQRLWATACPNQPDPGNPASGPLARATLAIVNRPPSQPFNFGQRKGPHALRLVQAQAAPPSTTQAAPQAPHPPRLAFVAPRALPVRPQPELAIYRKYTEAMLRRYLKLSLEAGRVPSLLGQDIFRGAVSHCTISGFDDVVIFVEDVNKCLAQLEAAQRFLLRKVAIEGYTLVETAAMRGLPLRSVIRRYTEALDRLTRLFLDRKLLQDLSDPELGLGPEGENLA